MARLPRVMKLDDKVRYLRCQRCLQLFSVIDLLDAGYYCKPCRKILGLAIDTRLSRS